MEISVANTLSIVILITNAAILTFTNKGLGDGGQRGRVATGLMRMRSKILTVWTCATGPMPGHNDTKVGTLGLPTRIG